MPPVAAIINATNEGPFGTSLPIRNAPNNKQQKTCHLIAPQEYGYDLEDIEEEIRRDEEGEDEEVEEEAASPAGHGGMRDMY